MDPRITVAKTWETDHTFLVCQSLNDNWGFGSRPDEEEEEPSQASDLESEPETEARETYRRRYSDGSSTMDALLKTLEMFAFKGSFMQTERYPVSQASNPCLEIDGIGLVGLPLSVAAAQALLSHNRSSGLDRLEIPAEEVRFANSGWDTWFNKEANAICTGLSGQIVKPLYRLKKLVLEGAASRSEELPRSDAIATLVVILPSPFQDGDIVFDHGVQSKTVRLAPQSHLFTSIVAAYSVVKRKMCAITSGYRLALHYEVLQPPADNLVMPPFPDMDEPSRALRQAIMDWKEDNTDKAPKLMAYFLQRKYPWDQLSLQALAGADALLMTHLLHLSKELQYHLYLVEVQLTQIAFADYDGPEDKVIPTLIDNWEVVDDTPEVQDNAIDMSGVSVDITGFDFMRDEYLNGDLQDGEPENEYEVDSDGMKIRIDETYNRTLFLLWPDSNDAKCPAEAWYSHEYACSVVGSISDPPSLRDRTLVKSLMAPCSTADERRASTRGLCMVAEQRNDMQMLLETLVKHKVAENLDLLGIDLWISAYRKFGWSLKSFYQEAVDKDASNPRRQALVTQLTKAARERSDAEAVAWCEEQQDLVLRSLNRSSIAEVDWLLELATTRGVEFMRTILYPQLKDQHLESSFWVHFIYRLKEHTAAKELGPEFVRGCVSHAADNLLVVGPQECAGDSWGYGANGPKKAGLTMEVFRLCVEAGLTEPCAGIFERIKRATETKTISSECAPWECYAQLTRSLDEYLAPLAAATAAAFRPFFEDAVACMLSASEPIQIAKGYKTFEGCAFSMDNLATLDIAIGRAGGL
ncbi:hypothetical protein DFH06DRAFT_1109573, partial [Mycena polygramma]